MANWAKSVLVNCMPLPIMAIGLVRDPKILTCRWSMQDVGSDGSNGGRTLAAAARAWSVTPPSPLALRGGRKSRQGRRGDDGAGLGR